MIIGYLLQEGVPEIRTPPFDGPANHVREICYEWMKSGHTVKILAKIDRDIWYSEDLENFKKVQSYEDRSQLIKALYFLRRIQYKLKLPIAHLPERIQFVAAVKKHLADCDLFYERAGWTGYGGGAAAKTLNTPLILEINGDHISELDMLGMKPEGIQLELAKYLTQQAINHSSHAISTGQGWTNRFLERWNYPASHITVVENGTQFVKILDREQLQPFVPQPEHLLNVVYIGAFNSWHGIDVGIKGFAKAAVKNPDMRLFLIGSGPQADDLTLLVEKLKIKDKVEFLGHLSPNEMAETLYKCHVGLSPYCGRAEFSGLKLLDYKAAALAVVASGKDGQPAVIQDGVNGCIVPPCDEDAIADALLVLSNDRQLCQQMGRINRIEAEEQHSWGHAAAQIEKIMMSELQKKLAQ